MTASPLLVGRDVSSPAALRELMGAAFTFSDQQFAVVSAPLSPHVVVAGAGSGKTTVMAARVVWLVATGQVRPEEVLGLTFTTKAANELATRVRTGLRESGLLPPPGSGLGDGLREPGERAADPGEAAQPGEAAEPTVATYNAYAAGLLREHGLRIGHEPDTRVVTDASRYQLAARAVAGYDGQVELLSDHPPTVIDYLLALDSGMAEHLVGPDDVRRFQAEQRPRHERALAGETGRTRAGEVAQVLHTFARREELLGLVEAYRRLKHELGLMDFSDQIALAAHLVEQHPEVGAAERERYRVVLLDEYQDTSVAQAHMLRRLFSGDVPRTGRGHPVTAVGDPNQAIYGWRGASVSNILGFGHDFPGVDGGSEAGCYTLTVNRRSDARILRTANTLAQPLGSGDGGLALEPRPGAAAGSVRVAVHETYREELGWLPAQVHAAHAGMPVPVWSEIAVLTRDNAHAADVFDALTGAEIPVEIVGLQGLVRLPEVAEVVATLSLLHDPTANADMLTLLTGPRWAVGARDLALLGRRAGELAGPAGPAGRDRLLDVDEELAAAVEGADPTEVASLGDALQDPGEGDYSPEARERFGLLAAELGRLREHVGEPLLDLVRRIIDVTGIDVELASSTSAPVRARRENLDLFVQAVGEFQALDGEVTLPALLAYLQAEDEHGSGLDVATPTEADSVKLLTVHRAKGLEWDAVFLVGVCEDRFPTGRSRTKWTAGPGVLPSPLRGDHRNLPRLAGAGSEELRRYAADVREHDLREELRLAYVAVTRPRHLLVVSSYCWTATRKRPLGPSAYQRTAKEVLHSWGEAPELWRERPARDEPNPLRAEPESSPWPVEAHSDEVARRVDAAARVRAALGSGETPQPDRAAAEQGLDPAERARVAQWDEEAERLLEEARGRRAESLEVPLPPSLSATALARLRDEPDQLAAELARPMPRRPSPAARFGTRFHAWVESSFGQQQTVDPDDLPGRVDAGIDDESDLAALVERFRGGPFGEATPVAVEAPFAMVLTGQVVRGRIDAVYAEGDGFLVVDWKTGRAATADPLQLAVYRLAWAELQGVAPEAVGAAFYYVRTGEVVRHGAGDLPGRAALAALLRPPRPRPPGA